MQGLVIGESQGINYSLVTAGMPSVCVCMNVRVCCEAMCSAWDREWGGKGWQGGMNQLFKISRHVRSVNWGGRERAVE